MQRLEQFQLVAPPDRQRDGNNSCLPSANHKPAFHGPGERVVFHVAFQDPGLGYSFGGGAVADTSVQLTSLPWQAALHVRFTDDPKQATVRVQISDSAASADFAVIDDIDNAEAGACQTNAPPQLVAISANPWAATPVIYLTPDGPADYRIFVSSKTFSARDAAALIVGARGGERHVQAGSL